MSNAVTKAVTKGDLDRRWNREHCTRIARDHGHDNINEAAEAGDLAGVKAFHAAGERLTVETSFHAATGGSVDVLTWLSRQGCPMDETVCAGAARHGHLAALQWARSIFLQWDESTCHNAALGGHLRLLKWARADGCPWDYMTCKFAVQGGHLDLLKWVHANGCPLTPDSTACAAERGDMTILEWLKSASVAFDKAAFERAAKSGRLSVFKWLVKNFDNSAWNYDECMRLSSFHDDLNEWIRKEGRTYHASCKAARLLAVKAGIDDQAARECGQRERQRQADKEAYEKKQVLPEFARFSNDDTLFSAFAKVFFLAPAALVGGLAVKTLE